MAAYRPATLTFFVRSLQFGMFPPTSKPLHKLFGKSPPLRPQVALQDPFLSQIRSHPARPRVIGAPEIVTHYASPHPTPKVCRKGRGRGGAGQVGNQEKGPCGWSQPGKGKRGKGPDRSQEKKPKKPEVDILSPAAMLNLYYIAHNVADCLHLRGFPWPGAPKSKKGKNKP
ncbi:small lysine-rich protein 1 [Suricata suricatta]|uniref:small lysine-rich protein 1 n=1 Tax=Suricata suricatta TaxID=37032 RepID=UPI001155622E|nr:small lysine-rich protein 1 [Suricata suricatta]